MLDTILYMGNLLYVQTIGEDRYRVYRHTGESPDFSALEECLDLNGEYV